MGGSISVRNDTPIPVDVSTCMSHVDSTKRCNPGCVIKFDTAIVWYTLKAVPVGREVRGVVSAGRSGNGGLFTGGGSAGIAQLANTLYDMASEHMRHLIVLVNPNDVAESGKSALSLVDVPGYGGQSYAVESCADAGVYSHKDGNYKVLRGSNDCANKIYKLNFREGKYGGWP